MKSKIALVLILICTNLTVFAKDVVLNKKDYSLDVKKNKMILLDFPFKIKDFKCFGQDSDWNPGEQKEHSVYFSIHTASIDCAVWSEQKSPILLSLKVDEENGIQNFSFYNGEEEFKNDNNWKVKIWNEDKEVAYLIDEFASTDKLLGFRNSQINEKILFHNILEINKIKTSENMKYVIQEWLLTNVSEELLDTHTIDELYYNVENSEKLLDYRRLRGHSFDNRYLAPGQSTKVYYVFNAKEKK